MGKVRLVVVEEELLMSWSWAPPAPSTTSGPTIVVVVLRGLPKVVAAIFLRPLTVAVRLGLVLY